jgi:hypothetical protein
MLKLYRLGLAQDSSKTFRKALRDKTLKAVWLWEAGQ